MDTIARLGLVENSEKENSEREKFWKKIEKGK
jgi:hypothetical protein